MVEPGRERLRARSGAATGVSPVRQPTAGAICIVGIRLVVGAGSAGSGPIVSAIGIYAVPRRNPPWQNSKAPQAASTALRCMVASPRLDSGCVGRETCEKHATARRTRKSLGEGAWIGRFVPDFASETLAFSQLWKAREARESSGRRRAADPGSLTHGAAPRSDRAARPGAPGKKPKTTPTSAENTNATATIAGSSTNGKPSARDAPHAPARPSAMPISAAEVGEHDGLDQELQQDLALRARRSRGGCRSRASARSPRRA